MADVRESFPVLEGASQEGLALRAVVSGDSVAAKNGLIGIAFRDSSGNAILPQLDSGGRLPVTTQASGINKKAYAKVTGSLSQITVVDLSLTASKVHKEIECIVACTRETEFEVAAINDPAGTPTEVILSNFITGPGQYSFHWEMSSMEFTSGATLPVLRVRAKNLDKISDMRATITALEVA